MKKHMPKKSEIRIEIDWFPQTWYGRLIAAVAGVLLLWFGIMFFTVFLFVIGLVSVVAIAFVTLAFIKTTKGQSSSFIEAEYHIEDKKKQNLRIPKISEKNSKRK